MLWMSFCAKPSFSLRILLLTKGPGFRGTSVSNLSISPPALSNSSQGAELYGLLEEKEEQVVNLPFVEGIGPPSWESYSRSSG